jgi:isochorismate synthase
MEQQRQQRADGGALLRGFVPETDFFFASPHGSLCASYVDGPRVLGASAHDLLTQAARGFQDVPPPYRERAILAGALPFDPQRDASLSIYVGQQSAGPFPLRPQRRAIASRRVPARPRKVLLRPTPAAYVDSVSRALARIEHTALSKVVLARAFEVALPEPLDLKALLGQLAAQNPRRYVFHTNIGTELGAQRALVGASPALLLRKRGLEVTSHPLGGSAPRSRDVVEDRERGASLLRCPKSRREHAYVVDAMASALSPFCAELSVPRDPTLVQTENLWHLGSKIVGRLSDERLSSLALACALHPTPAVCGVPAPLARAAIHDLDGCERDFFGGAVGYCDSAGDGEWALSIRCAQITPELARLYAGAGIVSGLIPEVELEETSLKLNTMLRALGMPRLAQVL